MLKSQIIEATSYISNKRVDFNIPSVLCSNIKLVNLGVFGTTQVQYPVDPVLGQLAVIKSIRLTENGQVLSQYDRRFSNLMQYKMLTNNNTQQRCIERKVSAHNYGLVVNNGGSDDAGNPNTNGVLSEAAVRPRICVDKKDLTRIAPAQIDTKFAILDLKRVLGFLTAQWDSSNADIMGYVPCHLFRNLKLSIEFVDTITQVALTATQVLQPYIIMDTIEDPAMEKAFMGKQAQWLEYELEEVFINNAQQANNFLNSFYGKTLANLHVMSDTGSTLSPNLQGEKLNLLVNQVPLFQQSGVDTVGKRAAFTQMCLGDLYIPLTADRVIAAIPDKTNDADASATSIFEGAAVAAQLPVSSSYYASGTASYLCMPIQQKIESLQLRYTRTLATNNTYLLFWGEVAKVLQMDPKSGAPVVSYV
jgi:hypothetical protein